MQHFNATEPRGEFTVVLEGTGLPPAAVRPHRGSNHQCPPAAGRWHHAPRGFAADRRRVRPVTQRCLPPRHEPRLMPVRLLVSLLHCAAMHGPDAAGQQASARAPAKVGPCVRAEPLQTIGRLHYEGGGDWYANPSSLPNLLAAVRGAHRHPGGARGAHGHAHVRRALERAVHLHDGSRERALFG